MKMRKVQKLFAILMTAAMLAGLLPPRALAADDAVHIRTREDWEELAQNCRLDAWSEGRMVILEADLDIGGLPSIPTFGGTLDGNGHTLTGVSLIDPGDHQGLIRYVRKGAVVKDLTVTGVVAPSGGASAVGALAGQNEGTITRCRFNGFVVASASVGGIVGVNEADGQIVNCTNASGTVSGEHFTGGIVGENYGMVVRCANYAQVNTQAVELTPQLEAMDWTQLNSTENLPACTDTGGIAGFSGGVLQGCSNLGTVGYPHLGYNVGGIAGRQSGYMSGCKNDGLVLGRKDVGGIVGQAEPYTSLRYEEDTLQKLTDQLDSLNGALSGIATNTDGPRQELSAQLSTINGLTSEAHGHASDLLGDVQNLGGATVDVVNDLSLRISQVLERARPIADDLDWASGQMSAAMANLEAVISRLQQELPGDAQALEVVRQALIQAESGLKRQGAAMKTMKEAMEELQSAMGDEAATNAALDKLYTSLEEFSSALDQVSTAVAQAAAALETLPEWPGSEASFALADLQRALGDMSAAADEMTTAINELREAQGGDTSAALGKLSTAFDHLADSSSNVIKAAEAFRTAIPSVGGALWGSISGVAQDLDWSIGTMVGAAGSLGSAFRGVGDILRSQASLPPLQLPKLPSDFRDKEGQLGSTLGELGTQLENVNRTANQAGDAVSDSIRQVSRQFSAIVDLLQQAQLDAHSSKELVVDVSEEDIASTTLGKVEGCRNEGDVEGDVNVGGVIGAQALEFDFDPEDDVTDQGKSSLRFQYLTRAIAQNCVNEGSVTSRKDSAGGIIGRMDLGVALGCEGYGSIQSTGGERVGGIAGTAYGIIRDSWAKCSLSALRRVGGIAGYGTDIKNCRSLVEIQDGGSYVGAIAGEADGTLSQNTFVSPALGGADGVSYKGKAEPVSYETLMAGEDVPEAFQSLILTFVAENKKVATLVLDYHSPVPEDKIPAVPKREGYYGQWSDFDQGDLLFDATVEAVYTPWLTTVSTEEGTILAEGSFGPEAVLTAEPADDKPSGVAGKPLGGFLVELENGGDGFTAVRVKLPEDCKKAELWALGEDGKWEKLNTSRESSYLRGEISGDHVQLFLTETISGGMLWMVAGGAAAAAVVILLVLRLRKSSKKKKTAPKTGK